MNNGTYLDILTSERLFISCHILDNSKYMTMLMTPLRYHIFQTVYGCFWDTPPTKDAVCWDVPYTTGTLF